MGTELVEDHLSRGTNQFGTNCGGPYVFGTKCVGAGDLDLETQSPRADILIPGPSK